MGNQRIEAGASFEGVYSGNGVWIRGVTCETIDGLSRQPDKLPLLKPVDECPMKSCALSPPQFSVSVNSEGG